MTQQMLLEREFDTYFPESIAWVTRPTLRVALNISEQQLTRDLEVLASLNLRQVGFDKIPWQRGFSRQCALVVWEYRKLVKERGKTQAILGIKQRMEELWMKRQSEW